MITVIKSSTNNIFSTWFLKQFKFLWQKRTDYHVLNFNFSCTKNSISNNHDITNHYSKIAPTLNSQKRIVSFVFLRITIPHPYFNLPQISVFSTCSNPSLPYSWSYYSLLFRRVQRQCHGYETVQATVTFTLDTLDLTAHSTALRGTAQCAVILILIMDR